MTTETNGKVLEVNDLRTYFYTQEGEVKAVDGLSYYVNKGESIGLVGESACGKSVSALSILRLIPYPPGIIVGGEIVFQGKDLLKATEAEMRHIRGNEIAMIFQDASLEETIRLLKLVGIPDAERRAGDYPFQFSGGMQQRIMIAMALSCDPAVLIADEPTTSVDVTVQAQLLEILADLRNRLGTAVIIITHNLGVVARYVDRVNVMYAGRLVETAPTDELYGDPKHPYTIGLLASVPRLDSERKESLRVIQGLPPNLARLPGGCSFHPRCEYAMPQCREEMPQLEKVGENHYRACFLDVNKLKKE